MPEGIAPQSEIKEFTAKDGARIYYRAWERAESKAAILYLHGLVSHSGWFMDTGNALNEQGFSLYALERRGSGLSQDTRGHIENYELLVSDVQELIGFVKASHPHKKVYIIALCWGAKIAAILAAEGENMIDGLILLGPAIKTKVDLSLLQKIEAALGNLFSPRKLLDVPLEDFMFTKNTQYLEFIKNDALKLKKATARFFFETGKLNRRLDRIAPQIRVPSLLALAGEDIIVDNARVRAWFARVESKDKTIKIYPGCYHSLEFENQRNAVITDIAHWINSRNEENCRQKH